MASTYYHVIQFLTNKRAAWSDDNGLDGPHHRPVAYVRGQLYVAAIDIAPLPAAVLVVVDPGADAIGREHPSAPTRRPRRPTAIGGAQEGGDGEEKCNPLHRFLTRAAGIDCPFLKGIIHLPPVISLLIIVPFRRFLCHPARKPRSVISAALRSWLRAHESETY